MLPSPRGMNPVPPLCVGGPSFPPTAVLVGCPLCSSTYTPLGRRNPPEGLPGAPTRETPPQMSPAFAPFGKTLSLPPKSVKNPHIGELGGTQKLKVLNPKGALFYPSQFTAQKYLKPPPVESPAKPFSWGPNFPWVTMRNAYQQAPPNLVQLKIKGFPKSF